MKRDTDALAIQQGAVNPSGIAYSLLDACKEIREAGGNTEDISQNPPVSLMVHQLALICRVGEIDSGLTTYSNLWKNPPALLALVSESALGFGECQIRLCGQSEFLRELRMLRCYRVPLNHFVVRKRFSCVQHSEPCGFDFLA